jgi:hypothetical protein
MAGTVVASTINNDTGLFATNNAYLGIAKAWVNINPSSGSSAVIRGSFNVSSVTYVGTGIYTVNFTTAMADINYSAIVTNSNGGGQTNFVCNVFVNNTTLTAPTTSAFTLTNNVPGTGNGNPNYCNVAVFGS